MNNNSLYHDAVQLLKKLISIPSYSGEENATADQIEAFLNSRDISTFRKHNNVWCYNLNFDAQKPTILLNSHHDTVKPGGAYSKDPFEPAIEDGKLFGLGSNDAGGCLVSLIAVFVHFYAKKNLAFNLCLAATAEEENSGEKGIASILEEMQPASFAIVGEPTLMQMAIAEKGSMVLDCTSHGRAGHAAREEGDNAIYKALKDIQWFSSYIFPRQSEVLGAVKMTVTRVRAGFQHNTVPAECSFTVDLRFTNSYTQEELLGIIREHTSCEIKVRAGVLKPSCIDNMHPMVKAGLALGMSAYVSPTSSDQGWLEIPSVKIGPGSSARSHMADEYIYFHEIDEGINIYIQLLDSLISYLVNNPSINEESYVSDNH